MRARDGLAVEPALYAWYLHGEMLDALFDETARNRALRAIRKRMTVGDHNAYTRELERWMRHHPVTPLDAAVVAGSPLEGCLVWCELPFRWSEVASERRGVASGDMYVRSTFSGALEMGGTRLRVHGSFNPARMTCSTANTELSGTRSQFVLGQVAAASAVDIELRPLAIATRFLDEVGDWPQAWGRAQDGQRIDPGSIDQFVHVDFTSIDNQEALAAMRSTPESIVKECLAQALGEPVVPKDWGGEQSDLWTTRLRVEGRAFTAAFLLKGPAGGALARPMTIAMLGKNGDQLQRLAGSPAEVLVIQHCHEIRPEVVALLRSLASDFRNVRRYLILDGYDSYAILRSRGALT
jgi:hypothetical protein